MNKYEKLINDLSSIRDEMMRIGEDMALNYNDEIHEKGIELIGAAGIALSWINGIRRERDK